MLLGHQEISSMEDQTKPLDGTILKLPAKLDGLLGHGCILPKGVEGEITLIKHDLEEILVILSNLEGDHAMMARCWRKEVRELSYDMEDFLDQYEQSASRYTSTWTGSIRCPRITQRRKSKTILPWLREKLRHRLWMADKIREFSVRVQEALQRHSLYNLNNIAGSASSSRSGAYSASSHSTPCRDDSALVGITVAMDKLEEWLMPTHDEGHEKLKVVSIVGHGGIGKTTLANELYRKLGWQFECRAFVRTSQKPDMRRLFISMLSQVRPHHQPQNWTVHSLISTIRTHLQDKRYLIVVDGLWATSTWEIVKCALPDNKCHSRILITTEVEDLALQSCGYDPKYVFKMRPLGEEDSRKLFFSSVIGPQHECSTELRGVFQDIIRTCGGLPLAIVSIASIISSQPGIHDQCDYINKSLGYSLLTDPTSEGMKHVLNLSYNNLPQHLKACLLYTSLYEEDIVISKDDLVNQWIAEGFIRAEGQDKQEIAGSFLDSLICRKLIQPVDINKNGEVLSCVVHSMVLNFITCKSLEENFITAMHHSQAATTLADKVRRLSLCFGNAEDAMPPISLRLQQIRTLSFLGVSKCLPSIVEFRLLQTVILHIWGDKDSISLDLTKISELFRLRYLKITSNVILELLTQIRGQKNLETIKIDARLSAVPLEISHLPSLLHLSLPSGTNLPIGISHFTSLRTLGYFDLSCNSSENVESLSKLTNLRVLQLTFSTVQEPINMMNNMQLVLGSILGKLRNLKSFTLVPTGPSYGTSLNNASATNIKAISGGGLTTRLERFEISPRICMFFCLPKCFGQLRQLRILKIGVNKVSGDDFDVLARLPALAALSVHVHTKPAKRIAIVKTGFKTLTYLKFKCSDPCLSFEVDAMRNLRMLKLGFNAHRDDQMSTIPVGIEHLSSLKVVSVKIGGEGPERSQKRAEELAFRNAMKSHARCPRVTIQYVNQITSYRIPEQNKTREYGSLKQYHIMGEEDSDRRDKITEEHYSGQEENKLRSESLLPGFRWCTSD